MSYGDLDGLLGGLGNFEIPTGTLDEDQVERLAAAVGKAAADIEAGTAAEEALASIMRAALDEL